MAVGLLCALQSHRNAKKRGRSKDFTFQHKLCHDFESLIWVIVYAMMIRRKNILMATDSRVHAAYKEELDVYWGVHSYTKLLSCHDSLIGIGTRPSHAAVEALLFSDPLEAEFFRAAMRVLVSQSMEIGPITYERIQGLFRTYIQKAEQATIPTLVSA